MNLSPQLLNLVTSAFNRYLAVDPEKSVQLGELNGKVICFEITAPELTVYCSPREKAVDLTGECEFEPDCTIRSSLPGLLNMMRSDDPAQSISSGEVEIKGDSRLAQRFSDILKTVELDWDELGSKIVGDFAAHKIGTIGRMFSGWAKNSGSAFQQDTSEYLREESGMLPSKIEIERFMTNVDDFRSSVDRLEAKIKRLEHKAS